MKHLSEFRDPALSRSLLARLRTTATRPARIMEVCGTHTMAIFHHGLRSMLPQGVELISGPGCPVCVTSGGDIDAFIKIASRKNVRVAIFGDLLRVPGNNGSLADAAASGAKVELVYSAMDALALAEKYPEELIVFLSVGFETTSPTVAATILAASQTETRNFCVYTSNKTIDPALELLLNDPDLQLDGLLCPGHVATIIGAHAFVPMAQRFKIPCVIGGFEPADIISALLLLLEQVNEGRHEVENGYERAVSWQGNPRARELSAKVFSKGESSWRGLGRLAKSGLTIRDEYSRYDAKERLGITAKEVPEPAGCLCGAILRGQKQPPHCPLFSKGCTPASPIGPCMVSSEGTCAAWHRYGGQQ